MTERHVVPINSTERILRELTTTETATVAFSLILDTSQPSRKYGWSLPQIRSVQGPWRIIVGERRNLRVSLLPRTASVANPIVLSNSEAIEEN